MMNYLALVRWPNLILVFAFQSLLWWGWIHPLLERNGVPAVLSGAEAVLLAICTVVMVAAGNVINDLYDMSVDVVNKPGRSLPKGDISTESAVQFYYSLLVGGAVLAVFLAWRVGHLSYVLIYLLFSAKLWFYSHALQRRPLTGNLMVALLSALFPWVFILAEAPALNRLAERQPEVVRHMLYVLLTFSGFAFFVSWARELIKDIEDMSGDKLAGYVTFPLLAGIPATVLFVRVLLGIAGVWIAVWPLLEGWVLGGVPGGGLALAIFYVGGLVGACEQIACYGRMSRALKVLMLFGMVYLGLYVYLQF